MKKSIGRLPKSKQEELAVLQELILKYLPETHMIILYGSFARGNYVLWEEGSTFDIPYTYQSDLDILIITDQYNTMRMESHAEGKLVPHFHKMFKHRRHASPQIIVENIATFNRALTKKHYFFYDIVKEGILLYDDQLFKLVKPHKLSFIEIKDIAQEEFDDCYPYGNQFLKGAYFYQTDGDNRMASFHLHQACERYYYSVLLVYINYRPKCHKLPVLAAMTKSFSLELANVFPTNTPENKVAYELLCRAYIEARYNRHFWASNEQLRIMFERTEALKEIVGRICVERIAYYEEKVRNEKEQIKENR